MSERGLPPNGEHDPMDEAYRQAEALLSDDAARAARRAKVLAAVAREGPAPASQPRPAGRRGGRQWAGWLVAASVAALGLFVTSQVYRPPPPPPVTPPTPAPRSAPVAAPSSPAPAAGAQFGGPPAAPARPKRAVAGGLAATPARTPPPPPPPPDAAQTSTGSVAGRTPAVAELNITAEKREQRLQHVPVAISAYTAAQRDQTGVKVSPAEPVRRELSPAPPPPAPPPPPPPPPPEAAPADRAAGTLAPPAAKAQDNVTELVVTAEKRQEVIERVPVAPSRDEKLRAAAAAGRTSEVKALLKAGAAVDATDDNGDSALMKAVEADRPATAAVLVRHGASLDQRNSAGLSPRDVAAGKHDPALQRALGLAP